MTRPRASSLTASLIRQGYRDATAAADRLGDLGLLDGSPPAGQVLAALGEAADPDLAVLALSRVVERDGAGGQLLAALRAHPGLRTRLVAVLGASSALGDHLAALAGTWRRLADDGITERRPSAYGLRRRLLDSVGAQGGLEPGWGPGATRARDAAPATLDALRLAYRDAVLELAARDLTTGLAVEDVAGELADLAAAALEAGLAVARAGLPAGAAPCRLAVIAMGKCGGRELNYVSDVDVVLVGEPTAGQDEQEALATATGLASGLVAACSATTARGQLFPVDLGLRPEGRHGPLVRTLASHQAYYARWARTWEFQALLKARPVAGDLSLGAEYTARLAPLVWSAAGRSGFVEEVQQMRRRVEENVPAGEVARELKLGPGGLRDVEFAVQLLQLVHGRADPAVRSATTLTALAALSDGGYVGVEDAVALSAAYRWLRRAEHLLQLQRLRRTHTLPADDDERRWLARALGYRSSGAADALAWFDRERARQVIVTRRLHEKLLYRPLLLAVSRLPADESRFDPRLSAEAAGTRLRALGFADPAAALRHLEALTAGVSRRAAIQRTLAPVVLAALADAADPDAGLLAFRRVSDALGETPWYLRQLRDDGSAAQNLAHLLATSGYVADLLVRAPEAVSLLADEAALVPRSRSQVERALMAVVARNDDREYTVAAARGLRRQELLRVACGELLGRLDPGDVGRALSAAAGATVAAALAAACRQTAEDLGGALPMRLAVIALGRLGGGELGYGSDADVLFVHEPLPGVSDAEAQRAASAVAEETQRLLALPAPDPPLRLDADLRPDGRSGPLSRSLAVCARYYRERAQTWEAQAMLRASACAGDAELARRFLTEISDPLRYPRQFTDGQVAEVRRLKARMEQERVPRFTDRTLHLKLGPGGLSDVEWSVQLLQLRHGRARPQLRTTSTLTALAACRTAGLIAGADAELLEQAWSQATRLRNAVILVTGRPSDVLPREPRSLAGVASVVGYPPGPPGAAALLAEHRELARAARSVVERVFGADAPPGRMPP